MANKNLTTQEWQTLQEKANAHYLTYAQDVRDAVAKVYTEMLTAGYNRTMIRDAIAEEYNTSRKLAPAVKLTPAQRKLAKKYGVSEEVFAAMIASTVTVPVK